MKDKLSKLFIKQKMMRTVLISLLPILIASIYFYGWRTLILTNVICITGTFTEYIFEKKQNKKTSEAVLVSCLLFSLTLPPTTPYWIGMVGIIFGIVFGKCVFGGFGRNVFNPALVARAFIYISFPEPMTIEWVKSSQGIPGGFAVYLTEKVELISQATPMLNFRDTGFIQSYRSLMVGNISGSIGEGSAILIILAGIYLVYKKVASLEIILSTILGYLSLSSILYILGNPKIPNPIFGLLAGGFLFGAVFMATDPITAPKSREGKIIYGLLIGIVSVIIRGYALFAGGVMFAILIGNTFAPIIDEGINFYKKRKKNEGSVNI